MRFIVDMPLSPALAAWLVDQGHPAIHASLAGLGQATDEQIIQHANSENQIIVTADLDYPRLLALAGANSPAVILFRGGNYRESEMLSLLSSVLSRIEEKELVRSIVVVDRHRIRRRPLPLKQK